ncbi:membrane bound O-acyl transferase family-domain-containing protein [Candidatus Bathyarchaeota archaeon]|nr:membrane bound O-acyl transferase family-domain-containing protein [Candidatus Bathyarchaeota archaeon]
MDTLNPALPLLIGAGQMVVVASTLAYTPKSSPLRLATLALIGGFGYWHYQSCPAFSTSGLWNSTCAAWNIIYCLHHIDLVILKRADRAELLGTTKPADVQPSALLRALNLCFSTRSVRSRWQIGNVPAFPSYFRNTASPGRMTFLFRTSVILFWQYLVLDLVDATMAAQPPEEQQAAYGNGQEYVLFTATKEQLVTRLLTSVAGSFFIGRLIMDFIYRAMSLVAVGTGISEPADWPPFFGRMRDAYTIRYFWGRFWHQWLRGPLSATSLFISRVVLGLPRRSLLEWYSNVFMTFTLSAAVHVANDVIAGKGIEIGTIVQFQGFAVAMLIEDAAQALYSRVFRTGKSADSKEKRPTPAWQLAVGYLWVQVVLFVVVPWYLYPSGRMPAGTMWTVPYSVVDVLGVQKAGVIIGGLLIYIVAFLKPEI